MDSKVSTAPAGSPRVTPLDSTAAVPISPVSSAVTLGTIPGSTTIAVPLPLTTVGQHIDAPGNGSIVISPTSTTVAGPTTVITPRTVAGSSAAMIQERPPPVTIQGPPPVTIQGPPHSASQPPTSLVTVNPHPITAAIVSSSLPSSTMITTALQQQQQHSLNNNPQQILPLVGSGNSNNNIVVTTINPGSGAGLVNSSSSAFSPATTTTPLMSITNTVNNNNVQLLNSSQPQLPGQQPQPQSVVNNAGGIPPVAGGMTASQQFQRLKVEDALSYLDKVKFSFHNHPQVYNDFLDIMKEFKSQSIDTPGVIQRVSDLFRGHPDLIFGFNTFLPPGYRIEIHANEQVSVSTPCNTVIIQTGGSMTTMLNCPPGSQGQLNSSDHTGLPMSNSQPMVPHNLNSKGPLNLKGGIQAHPVDIVPQPGTGAGGLNVANGAGTQPVEFNHAINYVNKIKNRYSNRPEVYKQFLEILHAYQKEQKNVKEGRTPDKNSMTDTQVYAKVAHLFQDQSDLLNEFALFLPESNSVGTNSFSALSGNPQVFQDSGGQLSVLSRAQHQDNLAAANRAANNDHGAIVKKPISRTSHLNQNFSGSGTKRYNTADRSGPYTSPNKRTKMTSIRDVTMADAARYGSLNDFAFFDKVRKAVRSQDIYDSFLRCLLLYNHEIVSRTDIVGLVSPYLGKFPELFRWFKEFVGYREGGGANQNINNNSMGHLNNSNFVLEGLPQRVVGIRDRERERMAGDGTVGMEIDYATCKRYGASYRALPKNYPMPKCSGRTTLCKEVLNDTWVSFPSWSEDSTFVTSKKTQYEEYISKCEDERFELDVVIETNLATIRVLEAVQKKLQRMTPDEKNRFKLDDCLGGTSATIHQRAIRRIYGDKAPELIDGLKKNPAVAVGIVLRRLKMKEDEWREAQKSFNKIWREQNERYYLKSLDHMGISFKANDIKFLRSKNLLNEIETIFDEHHDAANEGENSKGSSAMVTTDTCASNSGPHITLDYKDKSMIEESCNLIIHHIKRQTSIHKEDKTKIKQLMKHFIPDLFDTPRGELSDDELDELDTVPVFGMETRDSKSKESNNNNQGKSNSNNRDNCNNSNVSNVPNSRNSPSIGETSKNSSKENPEVSKVSSSSTTPGSNVYSLMFVNNNWYLFFRLHNILCERLSKMYERAQIIAMEEEKEKCIRKESTAIALRLKPRNEIDTEEYFPVFVDMIKQVLDGNMDGNQFEDTLREMFGIHAYIGFTMDKVVQNICRQLQHIVVDELPYQCTELYLEELKCSNGLSTGGPIETAHLRASYEQVYQKKAEAILTEENCFKIMVFKGDSKVTIELLDTETAESEDGIEIERWSEYIEKYSKDDDTITEELKERLSRKPIFLPRSIPSWRLKGLDSENGTLIQSKKSETKTSDSDQNQSQSTDKDGTNDRTNSQSSSSNETTPKDTSDTTRTSTAAELLNSSSDIEMKDDSQCRFNVNNYKMVFVVDSECYLYKRLAVQRARLNHQRVSRRLHHRFNDWHMKWLQEKGLPEEIKSCDEWLMGLCYERDGSHGGHGSGTESIKSESERQEDGGGDGTDSSGTSKKLFRTRRVRIDVPDKTPYRPFCKYKVEARAT